MHYFRMELHSVKACIRVFHGSYRAHRGMCCNLKSVRCLCNVVGMTHPENRVSRSFRAGFFFTAQAYPCKHPVSAVDGNIGSAVFAYRCSCYPASQLMSQKLSAVADSQHRNTQLKNFRVGLRRIIAVNAVRSAGKNYAGRSHFPYIVY